MIKCGIYKIQNKLNGKIYIGQSVNIFHRWRQHKVVGNNKNDDKHLYPLYKAMYKDGLENFDFSIIEECSKDKLNEREKYWILYYDSINLDKGYNLILDFKKEGIFGSKLCLEQVEEIKEKLLKTNLNEFEIGNLYGVNADTISSINNGRSWYDENTNYPIRPLKTKKLKCSKCGKELKLNKDNSKTGLCWNCYNEERYSYIPSREILKEKIRNQSFESIAKDYGFKSGNTIKKWCKKRELPYLRSEIEKYSDEEWSKI